MGRHALPPYEVENIKTIPHPELPGHVRARARYRREIGGPLLDVYGKGRTEAAAKRDLRKNLAAKRVQHHGGSDQITGSTTVEAAAQVWLSEKKAQRPRLAARTLDEYAKWISAYIDGTDYGRLTITAAANTVRGEQHLRAVANGQHKRSSRGGGEGAMRSARKVLRGIMETAARHGAIPTPVPFRLQGRTVEDDRRRIDPDRAFTREELAAALAALDADAADLGDLAAMLAAVGPRVSEALTCMSWRDVDLETGTVVIRGTKSKNGVRTVTVPEWMRERLVKRAEQYGTNGLVFGVTRYASKLGQPRDVSNVLDRFRVVLDGAGFTWAGSHTFRRTYATLADEAGASLGQIAAVLGQDPVTTSTYVKPRPVATAVDVLAAR